MLQNRFYYNLEVKSGCTLLTFSNPWALCKTGLLYVPKHKI